MGGTVKLFMLLALFIGVRSDQCWGRFRGVCVPMSMGYCPFPDGGFSWVGCPMGEICCFPTPGVTVLPEEPEPPRQECGQRQVRVDEGSFRIVGGRDSTMGAWPWVVSLEYTEKDDPHLCGAALINDEWILTAAHCFMSDNNPANYRAVIGQHNRSNPLPHEQTLGVDIILSHEKFNNPYKANDIALVRLRGKVDFGKYAQPVCMPEVGDTFEGDVCTVVGWGVPEAFTQEQEEILQEVSLPILPKDYCRQKTLPFHETNICAGYVYGTKDACGGDSGGPLVCQRGNDNHWTLAGIVSWGRGCARPERPGIYTEVSQYLDWIKHYTS